jgi:hypothetical protein
MVMAGLGPATHDFEAAKLLARSSRRHRIERYFRFLPGQNQLKRIGLLFCATGKSWMARPSPAMTVEQRPWLTSRSAMTSKQRPDFTSRSAMAVEQSPSHVALCHDH